jgi:hypothetical protein
MFDHFSQQPLSEGLLPPLFFDLLAFDRLMDCPHQQFFVKSSLYQTILSAPAQYRQRRIFIVDISKHHNWHSGPSRFQNCEILASPQTV